VLWRTVGQTVTTTGIVVEADIHFQKEENTREYSNYLQTCIASVHKNANSDLASSNPYNTATLQPCSQSTGLHNLIFCFETV